MIQRRDGNYRKSSKSTSKSQSAMEYLMTYGWAILIIAIVLVAFFSLNLFNPYTFAPKASPGSCQILRPNGPGSNLFVSAVGPTCTTNQIPQYVTSFDGQNTSTIYIPYFLPANEQEITIIAWVKKVPGNQGTVIRSSQAVGLDFSDGATAVRLFIDSQWGLDSSGYSDNGNWHCIAGTYNGTASTQYMDGNKLGSELYSNTINSSLGYRFVIGGMNYGGTGMIPFDGNIANIQMYNTSLSQSEITVLCNEGIGGAPTNLQNLVGWWPLNGNSNDYSGNGNNGVPVNVVFTSNWENGYTAP